MTDRAISARLRRLVAERAGQRCEYCLLPTHVAFFPHEVDHVVALKHGGQTDAVNLAFACWRCNRHKGTDLGSFDPTTNQFSFLFNPRTQIWMEHFALRGATLAGLSPEGRTTIQLLQLNMNERIGERRRLQEAGRYPIGANLQEIVYVCNRCPIKSSPQPLARLATALRARHACPLLAAAVCAGC